MTRYCNLARVKQDLDITGVSGSTSKTQDDTQLFTNIAVVSARIDGILQPEKKLKKRPFFAPYIESRPLQIRQHKVNTPNQTIDLNMYMLELSTVLAGTVDVSSSVAGYIAAFPPFDKMQINVNVCENWYSLGGCLDRAYPEPLTITGTWGWHADWDNAFEATSLLVGNLTDSATALTVTATEGALFSPGDMIQLGTEWMEVTAVVTDTLTVIRGVNGSTAAAHLAGVAVAILQIPEDIQRITARQAAMLYAKEGKYEVAQITQLGTIQYPLDLMLELINTISDYRM